MAKTATNWSDNPSSEANNFAYDDSSVLYDSTTDNYDGVVDADMGDRDILPTGWTAATKTATGWTNPTKTPTVWSMA